MKVMHHQNHSKGTGEKALWLRVHTVLPKVLSSIPSTHMVLHNIWYADILAKYIT